MSGSQALVRVPLGAICGILLWKLKLAIALMRLAYVLWCNIGGGGISETRSLDNRGLDNQFPL